MDNGDEISCIEFSEEAKAAFGVALQKIVDAAYNAPNDKSSIQSSPQQEFTDLPRPKCFTTLTNFTANGLVVNEIDERQLNEIIEQNILPISSSSATLNAALKKTQLHTLEKSKSQYIEKRKLLHNITVPGSNKIAPKTSKSHYKSDPIIKQPIDVQHIRCLCPVCSIELDNFPSWKAHIYAMHNFDQVEGKFRIYGSKETGLHYSCNECQAVIKTNSEKSEKVLYHRVSHSPNPICFECRLCNWRHHTLTFLMRHVRTHHLSGEKPKYGKARRKPNA